MEAESSGENVIPKRGRPRIVERDPNLSMGTVYNKRYLDKKRELLFEKLQKLLEENGFKVKILKKKPGSITITLPYF